MGGGWYIRYVECRYMIIDGSAGLLDLMHHHRSSTNWL